MYNHVLSSSIADGSLLSVLTESDVRHMNVSLDDLHVRGFMSARDSALSLDRPPTSFWEYKVKQCPKFFKARLHFTLAMGPVAPPLQNIVGSQDGV